MKQRRMISLVGALVLVAAGCGGGSDSSGPQTEEGAVDAVVRAQRGILDGDADAVLGFMSEECRASVNEDDVRLGLVFIAGLLGEEVDLDAIEISGSIEQFDGDTAEVAVEFALPDDADLGGFGFGSETIDVSYENGKWVADDCEFGDSSEQDADALADDLAAAGLAGTREDPVPAGVAAPVGGDFTVSIDSIDPDAAAAIEAGGGYSSEPDPGNRWVLVNVTVGYAGSEEPESLGTLSFSAVGGSSAVGTDFYGCNGMDAQLDLYATSLMHGGVTSGAICGEVPEDDIEGLVLGISADYGSNSVFFDPFTPAAETVPVTGTPGPSADGDLTPERQAPIAVGTATDLGAGWTLTVDGVDPDAAATIGAVEYNDPAPAGSEYVLVDVTLSFEGNESGEAESASRIDMRVVGDSNVATASGTCSVSWDGQLNAFDDVFSGGSVAGQVCFLVDSGDLGSLVLLATAEWGEDPDVFALG